MADVSYPVGPGLLRYRDLGDGTLAPVQASASPGDVVSATVAAASSGQPQVVLAGGSPVPIPGQVVFLSGPFETAIVQSVSGVTITCTANLASAHAAGSLVQWTGLTALGGNLDNQTLLASAARTATLATADQANFSRQGLHLVVDVTVIPSGSVTPAIQGRDPVSGKYYTLLTGAAIATVSTAVLKVYPGITPATNVAVSDVLPRTWRVNLTHADATSLTYSVAAVLLA